MQLQFFSRISAAFVVSRFLSFVLLSPLFRQSSLLFAALDQIGLQCALQTNTKIFRFSSLSCGPWRTRQTLLDIPIWAYTGCDFRICKYKSIQLNRFWVAFFIPNEFAAVCRQQTRQKLKNNQSVARKRNLNKVIKARGVGMERDRERERERKRERPFLALEVT